MRERAGKVERPEFPAASCALSCFNETAAPARNIKDGR